MVKQDNLDNWGAYTSCFLKAADVAGENHAFVVTNVTEFTGEDQNPKPRLTLESAGDAYEFDLNVTNANYCKTIVKSPRMLIGKKIFFKKVNATNPKTKTIVESLRIFRIE